MRKMYDATHAAVGQLPRDGDLYAGYVTGSPDIRWTVADFASVPARAEIVTIDQGFTGSPVLGADVRDVENGAWSLANAVDRTGWVAARPTLYLGFPQTVDAAHAAGWRGDVWVVEDGVPLDAPPPRAPDGIRIVASQREFTPNWDASAVFDELWPLAAAPQQPAGFTVTVPPPGVWKAGSPLIVIGLGPGGQAMWTTDTTDGHTWPAPSQIR